LIYSKRTSKRFSHVFKLVIGYQVPVHAYEYGTLFGSGAAVPVISFYGELEVRTWGWGGGWVGTGTILKKFYTKKTEGLNSLDQLIDNLSHSLHLVSRLADAVAAAALAAPSCQQLRLFRPEKKFLFIPRYKWYKFVSEDLSLYL
jgi:hypothetical protein